ncbi:MAG: molybdopterin-synthase adenylyltransferase MoeB [Verrucomicrobiota bacterium]|nr:molybdopterin-synthase adenylyltransferase MoeB [Verrucomicrobiota bacterium]
MELNDNELRRYSRHLILPEVGAIGQRKIRAASVLCVGAGGLGSPVALYLAAAGVGRLGILDFDRVDLSNLQRQLLHGTPDVGRLKVDSARETLQRLNPEVEVVTFPLRLNRDNALDLLRPWDIIVDGTDNFPARYLTNDACVMLGKPNVYGSIFRFEGQASLFAPHLGGPCYRCLFPEPPPPGSAPSCAEAGVLGVLPGIIGTIQATEALKLALGCGESLLNRLLLFDALGMRFREIKVRPDPGCPVCGKNPSIKELIDYTLDCQTIMNTDEVTVKELKQALDNPASGIRVIDVRELAEYQVARIPGAQLLPLSELTQRWGELDPSKEYYLHCKAGVRSMKALLFLRQQGFKHLKSVKGGISAWSDEIDASVPKY